MGIAAINVSKPLLVLCQISDTQSYINTLTKINIFNPQEVRFSNIRIRRLSDCSTDFSSDFSTAHVRGTFLRKQADRQSKAAFSEHQIYRMSQKYLQQGQRCGHIVQPLYSKFKCNFVGPAAQVLVITP